MSSAATDNKKNILLVEDEALIAMLEIRDLECEGYNVIHVAGGEEAVSYVSDPGRRIDLVLMDIDLGEGMDGTEAARRILGIREIPVIFLSSHTERDIVIRTEEITSYGYVVKNTGIAVLSASIRMAFRLFEANRKITAKNLEVIQANASLMELNMELVESRSLVAEREQNLKKSQELYSAIVENTHDSVYIYQDGILLYVNRLFCEISGYSAGEITGKPISNLIHPGDLDRIMDIARRRVRGEHVPRSYEGRVVMKDGSIRTFEFIPVDIELDGRHAVLGAAIDITERREVEREKDSALAALRESEEKYKRIFESFVDVYYRVDKDGIITELSPSSYRVVGWKPAELIGTRVVDLYSDPAERELFLRRIEAEGQVNGFEVRLRHKSGREIPISIHAMQVYDVNGMPAGVEGSLRDISDKKATEEKLRGTLEKYRVLVENTVDMIWTLDVDGILTYASPAWWEVLGYNPELVIGRHFSMFIHPDDVEECQACILKGISSRQTVRSSPYRVLNFDGLYRWHEANGIVIFNKDGVFESCIGISREIHERKLAVDHLYAAKEAADSASRAKSEFIANMSHEIRTPLNGLIGFTELLCSTGLDPQQKEYADKAMISARSLLDLVNDILDFSKIEAGKLELDEIETDIISVVEKVADIMRYPAEAKGIAFKLNISPDMPACVSIDPVRLRQALVNLAGNAVKFTESGEIELKVEFTSQDTGKGIFRFSVSDTGIGITGEQRERLFRAFTQGDASTSRKYGGTGLGLVITERLLAQMGSSLRLESEPGRGSCFSFELVRPYMAGKSAAAGKEDAAFAPSEEPAACFTGKYRILVAEDNDINLELEKTVIRRILPAAVIIEARDGDEAVEQFRLHKPHLVFMDVQMPRKDGYRAASDIRVIEKNTGTHVPVIALTAGAVKGERERCIQAGMDDYVTKPVDYGYFRDLLTRYLDEPSVKPEIDIPEAPAGCPRFDINTLMNRLGGDSALLQNLISLTFRYFGNYISELKDSVSGEDYGKSARLIHMIRGAALNACFTRLAHFACEFEKAVPSEHEKLARLAQIMEDEYKHILSELDYYLADGDSHASIN